MSKSAFVTGSTGLLGSHVVAELLKANYQVKALVRTLTKKKFTEDICALQQANPASIEWVEGSLEDVHFLIDQLQGVDVVFHCAAKVSFDRRDQDELYQINVQGTINLLVAAQMANVKKFVHTSSTAAIGSGTKNEPITEDTEWNNDGDHSWYGLTKHLAEREVWRASEEGLAVVIVNPSIIIGPGNWNDGSPALIKRVSDGLKFYTKGANAFVDVRDVAKVELELAQRDVVAQRFLVVGENATFKSFFEMVARKLGVAPPPFLANRWMSELAWRLEFFKSLVLRKPALITRETARSANRKTTYSSSKLLKTIPIELKGLDAMLDYTCGVFLEQKH